MPDSRVVGVSKKDRDDLINMDEGIMACVVWN